MTSRATFRNVREKKLRQSVCLNVNEVEKTNSHKSRRRTLVVFAANSEIRGEAQHRLFRFEPQNEPLYFVGRLFPAIGPILRSEIFISERRPPRHSRWCPPTENHKSITTWEGRVTTSATQEARAAIAQKRPV